MFPWLVGLTVISWVGNYPEPAAGNLDLLNFAVSSGLLLVLSVGVYVMAFRMRLSPEEVQAYIDETYHEASLEDEALEGQQSP